MKCVHTLWGTHYSKTVTQTLTLTLVLSIQTAPGINLGQTTRGSEFLVIFLVSAVYQDNRPRPIVNLWILLHLYGIGLYSVGRNKNERGW